MEFSLSPNQNTYPYLLREILDLPQKLYCMGEQLSTKDYYFAIVGTRHPSPYGKKIAAEFAAGIARAGFVVVSGLAYGIDAIAHEASLDAGGKTIAVLGSGLDHIGPTCNLALAERIKKNGTIITEFEHDTPGTKWTFPQRNRIIAGMSIATLVIEAPEKSGALITAGLALEYNRDIFALPGNITQEVSRGTNLLIQKGEAHLVTSVQDIFTYFQLRGDTSRAALVAHLPQQKLDLPEKIPPPSGLTEEEKIIYDLLKKSSMSIDGVVIETKLPVSQVVSTLSVLELKGLVKIEGSYALITR